MTSFAKFGLCSALLFALLSCGHKDESGRKPTGNIERGTRTAADVASANGVDSSGAGSATEDGLKSLVPFKLYWSGERQDNFTTGTEIGEQSAIASRYYYVRDEGRVFSKQVDPTMIPLKLYWNGAVADNYTVAGDAAIAEAEAHGYSYVRIEGYIYPTEQSGTVPLDVYYSQDRGDYFTTATDVGKESARMAGYRKVSTLGYLKPAQ